MYVKTIEEGLNRDSDMYLVSGLGSSSQWCCWYRGCCPAGLMSWWWTPEHTDRTDRSQHTPLREKERRTGSSNETRHLPEASVVSESRFHISDISTWWQTRAGDALVHTVDVIVEVATGRAHHANPWAGGQGVQVTTVVVAHRVAILHDGRSTAGKKGSMLNIWAQCVSFRFQNQTISKNKCKSTVNNRVAPRPKL